MKHLAAGLFAAVFIIFAGVVVWSNRTALTTTHLVFAGLCLALGGALALGTDFKTAAATVVGFVPALRGKSEPPPSGGSP
ncbi:MAG: hypothetical protein ACHQWU_04915 [Gemmatimonadales bacterium]